MRFIFLTLGYHPDLDGGAYRYAAEVAERLAGRGHEVHVISTNPKNTLPATAQLRGVHIHRLTDCPGRFNRNWRQRNMAARDILGRLRGPTTLVSGHHAYFEPAKRGFTACQFFHGPWGLEYALAQRARPRGFVRRMLDPWIARRMHRAETNALKPCRQILVASEYMTRRLKDWHPSATAPVRVVGGGVNFNQFSAFSSADRVAIRARWGLAESDFLFLTVRRLDPRMGLLSLIEAFDKVAPAHARARLWMAGRGPQEQELRTAAEARGLGDRVKLLGFVPEADLPSLYQSADCTVMPSLDLEGFGLATAESLACGTPVLASDSGANPEVVRALSDDLLFITGSAEDLAAKMTQAIIGAAPLPAREECAAYARNRFSWDRPADAFEDAFRDIIGKANA